MSSKTTLKVIIVGGGIGGLATAIALRRAGHSIEVSFRLPNHVGSVKASTQIFERSEFVEEVGAAVTLYPNAGRILDSWGIDHDVAGFTKFRGGGAFSTETLQEVKPRLFNDYEGRFGKPRVHAHRSDFHTALKKLATSDEGPGKPVQIRLSSPVASYDADKGSVTLADGSEETADLLVAADGVRSQAATYIVGSNAPATVSRSTVIRFLIPTEDILKNPVTAPLLQYGPGFWKTYISSDNQRYIVHYQCRKDALQNFGMYVLRTPNPGTNEFRSKADRNALRKAMEGFHPQLQALCDMASEILPYWICAEREPLPTCYRGRMVMVGDASHPMLPHKGQGAACSVEDAAALEIIFKDVESNDASAIANRLQIFQDVRLNRASATQLYSHENFLGDTINGPKPEIFKYLPESQICQEAKHMDEWFCEYDVVKDAQQTMNERRRAISVA